MKALAMGGVEDDAHMLVALPASLSVAKAIQLIKGGSSKWVHDTFRMHQGFEWQEGYGAFSIGVSGIDETIAYIDSQAEHHRTRTYEQEFLAIVKRHGMEYDERYVWG